MFYLYFVCIRRQTHRSNPLYSSAASEGYKRQTLLHCLKHGSRTSDDFKKIPKLSATRESNKGGSIVHQFRKFAQNRGPHMVSATTSMSGKLRSNLIKAQTENLPQPNPAKKNYGASCSFGILSYRNERYKNAHPHHKSTVFGLFFGSSSNRQTLHQPLSGAVGPDDGDCT